MHYSLLATIAVDLCHIHLVVFVIHSFYTLEYYGYEV